METTTADASKWEWIPCNYDFKQTTEDGLDIFYNLSPSIALTNPKGNGKEPKVEIDIECEKNFIYNDELGWNWHKSWNIPNFKVRVEIFDPETEDKLAPPKNLHVQVFAVKAMIENLERFHLLDIGIKGENKKPITESSEAYFSALKFSSTSYNNDSVKFHLVVCVQIDFEGDESPRILSSFISPPVFVDSRKSARDTEKIKAKKMSSLIDPFLPENLDKVFVKRENRRKDCNEEEITNSIEGLINYFTAPNVRHKVKHPLFLTIKFSNCISLYYNKNVLSPEQEDRLVENIQHLLYESQFNASTHKNSKIEKYPLIMVLKNVCPNQNVKSKKIMEHLESIQNSSLQILYDNKIIPANFKEIKDISEIKARYKKVYNHLASTKFKVMSDLAQENRNLKTEDESGEDNEQGQIDQTDSSSAANKKVEKDSQLKMTKIPLTKQVNLKPERIEVATKGGLERPKISKYEETVKKVKLEEGAKNEDNLQGNFAQRMEMVKPNSSQDPSKNNSIAAQLELMNRLLMINAMIGMNQGPQQQQMPNSQSALPMPLLNQQFQSISSMFQGQGQNTSNPDLSQLGALAQGFLSQSSIPSTERPTSTPQRSLNPINPDPRTAEQIMRLSMSSQNDINRLFMPQMPLQGNTQNFSSLNNQQQSSRGDPNPLASNLGLSAPLQRSGQGMPQNHEMYSQNFIRNNLMPFPRPNANFPGMQFNGPQDMLRKGMQWQADAGRNQFGVKEEDERYN